MTRGELIARLRDYDGPADAQALCFRAAFELQLIENERLEERLHQGDTAKAVAKVGLSRRELDVLVLIAAGLSNKQIANRFVVEVDSVKFHCTNLYRKLGVESRTAAAAWAHRAGVVP
jgi:DNA-binding NarL/FixJ family response regulator